MPGTQLTDLSSVSSQSNLFTGWADYADTQTYTEGSPLQLAANTDTRLIITPDFIRDAQKPIDVSEFYDANNGLITGRDGDGLLITLDFKAKPTSGGTTLLEVWFDIGGVVGELYRRPISFPKGNGVTRGVNFTVGGYTLDTFEANGAEIWLRANGTCDIFLPRIVLTRTHKAR